VDTVPIPPEPKNGTPPTLYTVYDEHGKEVARSSTLSTTLPVGRYMVHLEEGDSEPHEFLVIYRAPKDNVRQSE
jgi:hypothetical protein